MRQTTVMAPGTRSHPAAEPYHSRTQHKPLKHRKSDLNPIETSEKAFRLLVYNASSDTWEKLNTAIHISTLQPIQTAWP